MKRIIRVVKFEDAEPIAEIYRPFVLESAITFELSPPDESEIQQRLARSNDRFPWLVLEEGEQVCGYAYATPFRQRAAYRFTVETSVYVHRDFHRQGVGRQLMNELLERLVKNGFQTAIAGVTLPNQASVSLHESLGFQPVGVFPRVGFKFDKWHDVGFWHLDCRAMHELNSSSIHESPSTSNFRSGE